tara:strand:+ start:746 stop:1396 length:651 start_codon:yes stop_codon:yes gene_type:complete
VLKKIFSIVITLLISSSQLIADTVDYVLLNQKTVPQYFMIYNPNTSMSWAVNHNPTHMVFVARCTAYRLHAGWINAGQDATVFTAQPVGGKISEAKNRSQSTSFEAGLTLHGTMKRGSVSADGTATASFASQNVSQDNQIIEYAEQPLPSKTLDGVNYNWVPREQATSAFAKAKGFDKKKWGYVLYSSTNQGGGGCKTIYNYTTPYNFQENFGEYN